FQLLLVVVVELFGHGHSLLLDFHVPSREDQLPIGGNGVGDGGDGLLGKSPVRNLAVVLGNLDIAGVDRAAESIEQLLLESNENRRLNRGVKQVRGRTGGTPRVVPFREERCSGLES